MAMHVEPTARLLLPTRIRTKVPQAGALTPRIALAERLADLKDIVTADDDSGTCTGGVDLYLTQPSIPARKQLGPWRLCNIDADGLRIFCMSDWDKYQVIARHWGHLQDGHVFVAMPRDDSEVEVCWNILARAYNYLAEVVADVRHKRLATTWNLPHFSRSNFH
jgi:hypothetical protein